MLFASVQSRGSNSLFLDVKFGFVVRCRHIMCFVTNFANCVHRTDKCRGTHGLLNLQQESGMKTDSTFQML